MLKYKTVLCVLHDLIQQGWNIEIDDYEIVLKNTNNFSVNKAQVRYRPDSERKAQFKDESVIRFISHMEKKKTFKGQEISIKNLIGDKQQLLEAMANKDVSVIQPYIHMVTNKRDVHTGYYDSEIWRYFRYTWSIPYKSMPGRNMFYLVRDSSQPYHPVIGIFALGNSALNLSVRDNEIGWTIEAIKLNVKRRKKEETSDNYVSGTNGTVKATKTTFLESEEQYQLRLSNYADNVMNLLSNNLREAIDGIYIKDLDYHRNTKHPSENKINQLKALSEELRDKVMNNKKTKQVSDWEIEAKKPLFLKKRAAEMARLLEAKRIFNNMKSQCNIEWLNDLLRTESGRKAISTALIANRKTKIGSNMMEIIVCGAIPPYNNLLCGKLVSVLACSPTVIRDYREKYKRQISEIASRMKGKRVIRDSRLAFLGTTSLYAIGSSQYNRIKVPMSNDFTLQFNEMGVTEGYGTVYFSKQTTATMMRILELQDGGRRINNIFGEGTSPRFRLISRGMSAIGISSGVFLKHYSPRIVYSIELAKNTNDYLLGNTDNIDYPFDIDNDDSIHQITNEIITFWRNRWLSMRLSSEEIRERLSTFKPEQILVSNMR
jgi:hypothetical protein